MRLLLITVVILPGLAALATANPLPSVSVGLYGDAAGTIDAVYTDGAEEVTVYVVLRVLDPQYQSPYFWFSAVPPVCFNAVHVGDHSDYSVFGSSQTSVYVMQYFSNGSYNIMTITFSVQGVTPECCWFEPQLEEGMYWGIEGVWVNPNDPRTCVSPVESTTWGAIKAMYR